MKRVLAHASKNIKTNQVLTTAVKIFVPLHSDHCLICEPKLSQLLWHQKGLFQMPNAGKKTATTGMQSQFEANTFKLKMQKLPLFLTPGFVDQDRKLIWAATF